MKEFSRFGKRTIGKWLCGLLCLAISQTALSQKKKDTLGIYREFISVCNAYKELPLQTSMTIRNSANAVLSAEDTMQVSALFYLNPNAMYIRYGDIEQVADDSLLLVVSDHPKRIYVYRNSNSTAQQLKRSLAGMMQDSSALMLARKYQAVVSPVAEGTAHLLLKGRAELPGTDHLSAETIEADYVPQTQLLTRVTYTKRSLVSESSFGSTGSPGAKTAATGEKIVVNGTSYFIYEKKSVYSFDRISHQPGVALPASVKDRIAGMINGKYQPAKGYEDYLVRPVL